MTRARTWTDAGRILCVRLDSMGDVLLTAPAMRALKESRPGREVSLLTAPQAEEAAALLPDIDEVLVYDAPWMKATTSRSDSRPDLAMVARLRTRRFDAAVVFTVYSQSPLPSAMLCFLADIPLRLAHCRENPYQLLTDAVAEREPEDGVRHEVRRQLDLVATVGARTADEGLSVVLPPSAPRRALRHLRESGVDAERVWIVVHPGASAPSRRYPPEGFAAVANRLVSKGIQVVFTGLQQEVALVRRIQDLTGVTTHSLAGRLTAAELAALLSEAPLLVTNNTGPAHLAAAVGTPVVDLYALTNPQHAPWGVPHRLLFQNVECKYCYKSVCPERHHRCLRMVRPEQVVSAVGELLRPAPTRPRVPLLGIAT